MSENTLDFKINGARNMDIRYGLHGRFAKNPPLLLDGGIVHTVQCDQGDMFFQIVPTRHGSMAVSGYHFDHAATLSAEANIASLELMHLLEGNISFKPDGIRSALTMDSREWQMMYLPHINNQVTFPAGTKLTTLDIHFNNSLLENLAPFFPELDAFLNNASAGKAGTLNRRAIPFDPPVTGIVANFLKTRTCARSQGLFLERHLFDWLATALESNIPSTFTGIVLTTSEEKMLLEVFETMMDNFDDPLTISQLATKAGMNEFKFKKGFKSLFKKSAHKLHAEERLKKAKELIVYTDYPLTEIAMKVGYISYAGFSKEFKKKYGLSPLAFRPKSPQDITANHLL